MTDKHRPEETQSRSSLFVALHMPGNRYNEAFTATGEVREHWRNLIAAFDSLGPEALMKRQLRARRMRHEDGATFNPFDDASGRGTPWALETIPFPLTAREWSMLECGLSQRAMLFETILADVYGNQELFDKGAIPAELIFDNPRFLRPCHAIIPPESRFLPYYAADLYRDAQGSFRVLRDYAANPAGLGYALENRIVVSRIYPELYHATQIQRLAPFFHTLQQSLVQRASARREDPNIVLLSPGSESSIYFEHALLSRYLSLQLVESQDLTVRNGKVFLKKLAGLEPVDSIFRHIDDQDCDPFALRRDTITGVAGLIQAARENTIDIANPLGSGFIDTPALKVFLPELCRMLRGEELFLANHASWWCGLEADRQHVLANLDGLHLHGAVQPHLYAGSDAAAAIAANPSIWLAEEPIHPSMVPTWDGGRVVLKPFVLRVFLCATSHGFVVMPGGLAITANDLPSLLGTVPERQQSKDIWVLSDQPVEHFSLMSSLQTIGEFRRSSDLPSRVADNLLWLGRYLERAEGLIRLLRSVFKRLAGEARAKDIPELPFLLSLLEKHNSASVVFDAEGEMIGYRQLQDTLRAALYSKEDPGSIATILRRVQDTARNVRDRLSLDSWRVINRLDDFSEEAAIEPLSLLDDTLFTLSSFSGLSMESMTRGLGWRFIDMGRRLERALHQTGLIHTGISRNCVDSQSALESLLEVSDSIMTYRARYRTAFQLAPVLDLLIVDETNPKSLAFQCSQLANHVEYLPRQTERRFASPEERISLEMLTSVRLLDLTRFDRDKAQEGLAALLDFLEKMEAHLLDFSQHISAHYLSRVPTTPHFSTLITESLP